MKIQKKKKFFFFWGGVGLGVDGGWERRSEACVKIQKKIGGWGSGGSGWEGGQGGCEWKSEAFVKIQKKKNIFFFFLGGGRVRGSDWGGVSGWMGMEN